MLSENHPVTIVGASLAGLYAAYRLARVGVPVQVYEAQAELSPAPRTLIVTPAWLRLLDFDAEAAVLNRTQTFELISAGASARIPLRQPDLIVERDTLLHLLAREVRRAGGQILLNHRLEGVLNHAPSLQLRFHNGRGEEVRPARSLLGADGVHSTTAQAVGRDGFERVALIQARVALPSDLPPDTTRVWFEWESTRFFYWLIPESARTGVAGLIADTPEQAEQALQRFLRRQNLEPIAYEQDALVPMHPLRLTSRASAGDDRVLLMGDAAAQVKVTTVGGVVTGMRGAAAAARALVRGTAYGAELAPLRKELNLHALARRVLDGFSDQDYDQLLGLLNQKGIAVLSRYHRDELARAVWRLLPAQPRWLWLGARALVRSFWRR